MEPRETRRAAQASKLIALNIEQKYATSGPPTIQELRLAQGTVATADPRELLGDFWPEDENIDDFLLALRAWRGTQ